MKLLDCNLRNTQKWTYCNDFRFNRYKLKITNDLCFRANKLLKDHKNPLIKLDLQGLKLFIPSKTEEEAERLRNAIAIHCTALEMDRVDRRLGFSTFFVMLFHSLTFKVRSIEVQLAGQR